MRDAKVLQVVRREVGQDRLVYFVLAERSLVLPEAQAPQPNHDVHRETQASLRSISSCGRHGEDLQGRRSWQE